MFIYNLDFTRTKNSVGTDLNQVDEKVARDSINSILVTEGGNESDLIASGRVLKGMS